MMVLTDPRIDVTGEDFAAVVASARSLVAGLAVSALTPGSRHMVFAALRGLREDLERVELAAVAHLEKLRTFFNHPGFVEPMIERTKVALEQIAAERRNQAALLFSAHSIPHSMAATCSYEVQLREAARLIANGAGHPQHRIVYQSRSGPPTQPWLEPDVGDVIRELAAAGTKDVIVAPVGFISDLPTMLVSAFRATLEEVLTADLILHVRDLSHEDAEAQSADVIGILRDLGVYILELLDLSTPAADGVTSGMFVIAPLRIHRGVNSPLNPLLVV